jgi:hypothetical protein
MNLTRRQITIVVASLLDYQQEYRRNSEMYKDIDELAKLFDLEHQRTLSELAQGGVDRNPQPMI